MIDACLPDSQLWSVATGESAEATLGTHVDRCHVCTDRVAALRAELKSIREVGAAHPISQTSDSELPDRVGGYKILSLLGKGGQADVYRAWHPRLKIDVVIKWYRAPIDDPGGIDHDGASALCTVHHPNLGQLYDVGIDQKRPFQVMEYLRGDTFNRWIQKYQPSLLRIITVLAKVARAVDFVHEHGALHLDLKPGNILVDDLGVPRVIDFAMTQLSSVGTQLRATSPGTPEYTSPEQCAGDVDRIGIASDVYGLGAVLFSALANKPPRTEQNFTLEPNWKLLKQAPRRLQSICRKAMAIVPAQRQQSARAFAEELDRYVELHHWSGRSISTVVSVTGALGLLLGLATAPPDHMLATSTEISVKAAANGSRPSLWHVNTQSNTSYEPHWFLTTGESKATLIRGQTSMAPDSGGKPRWISRVDFDFGQYVGPSLLDSGPHVGPEIDLIQELQALNSPHQSCVTAQLTPGGIEWFDTLKLLSTSERLPIASLAESIRRRFLLQRPDFHAVLIIPPRERQPNRVR